MAIGHTQQSGKVVTYLNNYIADTEDDIKSLPTTVAPGSKCEVAASGNTYILNNKHKWILFNKSSGGSGGGGGTLDADWGTISGDSGSSSSSNSDWGTL